MLIRDRLDGEAALDRIVTVLIWSTGALVSAVLVWMIAFLVIKGLPALKRRLLHRGHEQGGPDSTRAVG